MTESERLTECFEEQRSRLIAVAYRMLGSAAEADDAVQEAWLRFSRTDIGTVDNLGRWLTTVVSRVCLNLLEARRSRTEEPLDVDALARVAASDATSDPEQEALLADSIGLALLVVLDSLAPAERIAFVLHDMFSIPFEEIAPIVGRSTDATRKLASRARGRVQGKGTNYEVDGLRQSELIDAFLAAARKGDFRALLAMLDPDVVIHPDGAAAKFGAVEIRGARNVARAYTTGLRGVTPALIDGAAGAAWMPGGQIRGVMMFTIRGNLLTGVELIGDPERLAHMEVIVKG